jgi:hypothetical protein
LHPFVLGGKPRGLLEERMCSGRPEDFKKMKQMKKREIKAVASQ